MKSAGWIGAGGLLLLWPAVVNRYPIVFSDTAAIEAMGLQPTMGWDKPWVYGPLTLLFHAGITLWGVAVAQALVLSAMLWLAGRVLGLRGALWHGVLCAVLAVGSAAPWFASFVMPDIFAPLTVLSLFVLGWGSLSRMRASRSQLASSPTNPVMPRLDPGGAAKRFRRKSPWNGCGGIHAVRLVTSDALSHRSKFHAVGRRRPDVVDGRIKSGHDGAALIAPRLRESATIAAVAALAAISIAAHLTHLVIAAACLAIVLLLRPRRFLLCAVPLAAALAWLIASNLVGNGVAAVSPYGSVFALARLQADGPATDYLRSVCPQAKLRTCRWLDRMPMDSDTFLWDPNGPTWADQFGPTLFAPEAAKLVRATIAFEPWQVARAAALNALRQLGRNRVGDTLGPDYLEATVGLLLRTYFPAAEQARFAQSRQLAGRLAAVASPFVLLQAGLLAAGAVGTLAAVMLAWRRWPELAALAAMVLVGVLANAFATGALSGPHDRYGARIAWLVLLPPLYALLPFGLQRRDVALRRASDDRLGVLADDPAEKGAIDPVVP